MRITYKHRHKDDTISIDLLDSSIEELEKTFSTLKIHGLYWHMIKIDEWDMKFPYFHFFGIKTCLILKDALRIGIPSKIIMKYYLDDSDLSLEHLCKAYIGKFNNYTEVEVLKLFNNNLQLKTYVNWNSDQVSAQVFVFDKTIALQQSRF